MLWPSCNTHCCFLTVFTKTVRSSPSQNNNVKHFLTIQYLRARSTCSAWQRQTLIFYWSLILPIAHGYYINEIFLYMEKSSFKWCFVWNHVCSWINKELSLILTDFILWCGNSSCLCISLSSLWQYIPPSWECSAVGESLFYIKFSSAWQFGQHPVRFQYVMT